MKYCIFVIKNFLYVEVQKSGTNVVKNFHKVLQIDFFD